MTEHTAGKLGITGVHNPRGEGFAPEKAPLQRGENCCIPAPYRDSTTGAPYSLQTLRHSTLYPYKPRRNHTKETVVCLPAPETESSGTRPAPQPAPAPRFLGPSTKDAHVSLPSPPLPLLKYLQPKGIAVPDLQNGPGHKLGAFAQPLASPNTAALRGCAREARGGREALRVPL